MQILIFWFQIWNQHKKHIRNTLHPDEAFFPKFNIAKNCVQEKILVHFFDINIYNCIYLYTWIQKDFIIYIVNLYWGIKIKGASIFTIALLRIWKVYIIKGIWCGILKENFYLKMERSYLHNSMNHLYANDKISKAMNYYLQTIFIYFSWSCYFYNNINSGH